MTPDTTHTDKYRTIKRGAWRWTVREDCCDLIDSPIFKKFGELLRAGEVRSITVSKSKTTVIVPASVAHSDVDLIVKNYRFRHWHQKACSWVRRMVGMKELQLGIEIQRRGIPVSVPVAVGEKRVCGIVVRSFVALERIPDVTDVELFAANVDPASLLPEQLRLRRKVIRDLGALVRKMHKEGIYQYDFNPCNFLVNPQTGDLTVIDFAKVKIFQNMPEDKALENLGKFARRRDRIPMTDVLRFLHGYVGTGGERKDERFGLFRVAERVNREIVARDLRSTAERCMNHNRKFAIVNSGSRKGIFLKGDNKFGKYDDALVDKFVDVALVAEVVEKGVAEATIEHFGRQICVRICCGENIAIEAEWQRRNMLLHAGLIGDVPLALVYFGDGKACWFSEPMHKKIAMRADRAMALMGLLNSEASNSTDKILIARAVFLYGLRGLRFAAPSGGEDIGADWFAVRRKFQNGLLHFGVRFGGHGTKRYFRLEVGVGEAGSHYAEMSVAKRKICGGTLPLSEVLMADSWARFGQRFRNVWMFPAKWNTAATDAFYYTNATDLPKRISQAAALVRERLPLVMEIAARTA